MSLIVNNYIPEEGIMVFSDDGYQRVTSAFNDGFPYQSRIGTDILPSGKGFVDSCWETGNIYYADGNDLHKIEYNGDFIADYNGCNAVRIAVSQAILPMVTDVSNYREDNGCWVVRNSAKELVKTDNNLNIVSTIINLSDPILAVSSDMDGGCYLFDDGLQWIMKIGPDATIQSYISYSSIYSGLTSASIIDRAIVDHVGNLWILMEKFIFKVVLANGAMYKSITLDPLTNVGLTPETSTVNDFDIDRNSTTANLYVVGGCKNRAWILKYNLNGDVIIVNTNVGIDHPVAIKVTQYSGSNGVYVITESDPLDVPECESSSSSWGYTSSSSSSSWGYSSISSISSSSSSSG